MAGGPLTADVLSPGGRAFRAYNAVASERGEIAERAGQVRDALAHDPRGAIALLDGWEAQTLRHLRLAEAGRKGRELGPRERLAQPASSRR